MRSEVQVLLDPPYFARRQWGLSSAGRASALQAEGHRFDPDRLHHSSIRSASSLRTVCSSNRTRVTPVTLTSFREKTSELLMTRVRVVVGLSSRSSFVSKSSTLTALSSNELMQSMTFDLCGPATKGGSLQKECCSFWIKSSAKRAFGGCLGSKRR